MLPLLLDLVISYFYLALILVEGRGCSGISAKQSLLPLFIRVPTAMSPHLILKIALGSLGHVQIPSLSLLP